MSAVSESSSPKTSKRYRKDLALIALLCSIIIWLTAGPYSPISSQPSLHDVNRSLKATPSPLPSHFPDSAEQIFGISQNDIAKNDELSVLDAVRSCWPDLSAIEPSETLPTAATAGSITTGAPASVSLDDLTLYFGKIVKSEILDDQETRLNSTNVTRKSLIRSDEASLETRALLFEPIYLGRYAAGVVQLNQGKTVTAMTIRFDGHVLTCTDARSCRCQ